MFQAKNDPLNTDVDKLVTAFGFYNMIMKTWQSYLFQGIMLPESSSVVRLFNSVIELHAMFSANEEYRRLVRPITIQNVRVHAVMGGMWNFVQPFLVTLKLAMFSDWVHGEYDMDDTMTKFASGLCGSIFENIGVDEYRLERVPTKTFDAKGDPIMETIKIPVLWTDLDNEARTRVLLNLLDYMRHNGRWIPSAQFDYLRGTAFSCVAAVEHPDDNTYIQGSGEFVAMGHRWRLVGLDRDPREIGQAPARTVTRDEAKDLFQANQQPPKPTLDTTVAPGWDNDDQIAKEIALEKIAMAKQGFTQTANITEFAKAFEQSEFKRSLLAFIATFQTSALIALLADKLDPEQRIQGAFKFMSEMLKLTSSFSSLWDLVDRLLFEVFPALWFNDPSLIQSELFTSKLAVIQMAVAAGQKHLVPKMEEVICKWRGCDQVTTDITLTFYEVICEMIKFVNNSKSQYLMTTMRTVISELTLVSLHFYQLIEMGRDRFQPFCIGFTGDAGVGKTTMVDNVQLWLGEVLSCPLYDVEHEGVSVKKYQDRFVITPGTDFDENARNDHWMVVFDDMGIITKEFQEKGSQNTASKFMQVQASIAYSMNKANLAEKKGSFWGNVVTVATSNQPDFGLSAVVADESAWKRRFNMIVTMKFLTPEHRPLDSTRLDIEGYYSFDVNYMDINTQQRHLITMKTARQVLNFMGEQALAYKTFRINKLKAKKMATLLCATCKQTLHQCTCARIEMAQASGLWLHPAQIEDITARRMVEIIAMEELISVCILYLLSLLVPKLIAYLLVAIFREVMEFTVGKSFNILRFGLLMFSLPVFPWSIPFHVLMNGPLFLQKLKTDDYMLSLASRFMNHYALDIQNLIYNSFKPRIVDWMTEFNFRSMKPKDYVDQYKTEVTSIVGISALVFAAYVGSKYSGYTQTALGQEGNHDDQNTAMHLEKQVQGAPASEMHGKTSSNDWKMNTEIVYKKSAGNLRKCVRKTNFQVQLIHPEHGQVIATARGFFSGPYFHTVEHLFTRVNIGRGHLKYWTNPDQPMVLDDVDLQAPHIVRNGDGIAIPVSHNFDTLPISCDYRMQIADRVWVDNEEVDVLAAYTFGDTYPLVYKINKLGNLGLSGAMVVLTEKAGVKVDNVIVGKVVALANADGLTLFEPYPSDFEAKQKRFTLSCKLNETYLENYFTPEIIRQRLWELHKVEVKPTVSEHSVLKHLPAVDGVIQNFIGQHVGTVNISLPATRSSFYQTELYDIARQVGSVDKYTIPTMKPFVKDGVYHNSLLACVRQMNSCGKIMAESPFWSAFRLLFTHIKETLGDDLQKWRVYDVHTAIVGDEFMNGLNRESAIGFPHHGIKDDIIFGTKEKAYFNEQTNIEIYNIIADMDKGIPPLNISKAALKDEVTTVVKNENAQIRVFFGGNTSYLILCRMYLGQLMTIFGKYRQQLFCKIGLNAIGPEFDTMARNMFKKIFGTEKGFETTPCFQDGDFEKYDKVLLVLKYAVHVLWWLANEVEYFKQNPVILNRIKLILTSMKEYIVIIGQDMFLMENSLPSGLWATALINCLCEGGIEILMFYFLIHTHQNRWFRCDFVAYYRFTDGIDVFQELDLSNYGDDNFKCIAQKFWPCYNHDLIMAFSRWIHMGITPARKQELTVKMKPITEVLFLKRVYVWNSHLNRFVGALEINSIAKMLAFSDTVEKFKPQWRRCVLDTARRELSFHGPEVYYNFVKLVNNNLTDYNIKQTWEETLTEIDEGKWDWSFTGYVEPVMIPLSEIILSDGQNLGPQNTIRHSL